MAKNKFQDSTEFFYFVSSNEKTLPPKETIFKKIEECIPSNYKVFKNRFSEGKNASHYRFFLESIEIDYNVEQIDPNRYKISLKYKTSIEPLGALLFLVGIGTGGAIGKVGGPIGMVVGLVIGGILFYPAFLNREGQKICGDIEKGIKEFERAHLYSSNTGYKK